MESLASILGPLIPRAESSEREAELLGAMRHGLNQIEALARIGARARLAPGQAGELLLRLANEAAALRQRAEEIAG